MSAYPPERTKRLLRLADILLEAAEAADSDHYDFACDWLGDPVPWVLIPGEDEAED